MKLISPRYLDLDLWETSPSVIADNLVDVSLWSGATPEGAYVLQTSKYNSTQSYFINITTIKEHKLILIKPSRTFFIVVQLENTIVGELCTLANAARYEWSINLYYTENFFWEVSLQAAANYTTFILFIPLNTIDQYSQSFPPIARFTQSITDGVSDKLLQHNAICNYTVIDLIHSLHSCRVNEQVYQDLILECFRLLSTENVPKQSHIEEGELHKVYALKKFMAEHTKEKSMGKKLPKQFDLTLHHFYTVFPQIYGVSPLELDRYFKMRAARRDWQEQDMPLKELAVNYGYTSASGFVKAYKGIYGQHPKAHRKSKV